MRKELETPYRCMNVGTDIIPTVQTFPPPESTTGPRDLSLPRPPGPGSMDPTFQLIIHLYHVPKRDKGRRTNLCRPPIQNIKNPTPTIN